MTTPRTRSSDPAWRKASRISRALPPRRSALVDNAVVIAWLEAFIDRTMKARQPE